MLQRLILARHFTKNVALLVAVRPIQEIRRPKQFDDDAEGGSGEDGSDEAADQVSVYVLSGISPTKTCFSSFSYLNC